MKGRIKIFLPFGLFIFFIIAIVGLNLWDFGGTVAFFALVLIGITVATLLFPKQFYSIFAIVIVGLGKDNNYRLYAMATLTLLCLIAAVKYGPGDPLLPGMVEETASGIRQFVGPENERTAYTFLWGKQNAEKKYAPKSIAEKPEPERKSWFLWKLFAVFALFTVLYYPISRRDEVANYIDELIIKLKGAGQEIKNVAPGTVATAAQTITQAVKATAGRGLAGQLYESGLATDFFIRILKRVASFFGRR